MAGLLPLLLFEDGPLSNYINKLFQFYKRKMS